MVYVDDFRISGSQKNLGSAWERLTTGRSASQLDPPKPPDRELGCSHRHSDTTVSEQPVGAIEYDMRDFMRSCVTAYLELTGASPKSVRHTEAPFIVSQGGGDTPEEPNALRATENCQK